MQFSEDLRSILKCWLLCPFSP